MNDVWLGIIVLCSLPITVLTIVFGAYTYVCRGYLEYLVRIFQEKPLFVIPRGDPDYLAEDVDFTTPDGLTLRGCYLHTTEPHRRGVILFGLEFGANRWSCRGYCEALLNAGYDIFAFEPRNQGASDSQPGYEPLHWLTRYEVIDTLAAAAYLKSRSDADLEQGIGYFGISKGGSAGMVAASLDRTIRCVVTDGAFGICPTMIPYMRKWVSLYNKRFMVHGLLPAWFYGWVAMAGIRMVERKRHVHFVFAEKAIRRLRVPLLMIHGEADTLLKVDMARELFRRAGGPKIFWTVPGAKHNQALQVAGEEYPRRVVGFFDLHLAGIEPVRVPNLGAVETDRDGVVVGGS